MKNITILVPLMGCLAGPLLTPAAAEDTVIVRAGDSWRYFKGTSAPPRAWKSPTFDDRSWAQGPGGIGYSTDIQYGTNLPDMHRGYWSVFMRRKFSIADPKRVSALKLAARYDDGFVAYVNGTEIARSPNMIDPVTFATAARSAHDEQAPEQLFTYVVAPGLLQTGDNVLAIEFHNDGLNSSDAGMIPRLILVDNLAPEASLKAGYPATGEVPLTVVFDASRSKDPDGNIVDYTWDFGDGTPVEKGASPTRSHTYSAKGVYQCVVGTRDDRNCTGTATAVIGVGPARTIHVDKTMTGTFNGSGDAVGTYDVEERKAGAGSATAYNTIAEASAVAVAGDTIMLRGGTYNETLRPVRSGIPSLPITYRNHVGEVAVIRNTPGLGDLPADEAALDQSDRGYGIYLYKISHVVIEGLQVTNVAGWARIVHSDHVILKRNTFTAALAPGTTGSIKFFHSDSNKVLDNTIHDGNDNLLLIHSDRNLVAGNHFMKGRHTLWCIRAGNFNVIRNNYFHNDLQKIGEVYDVEAASDAPVAFDAAHYNVIERNVFAKTASSGNHSPFAGIQYAGQNGIIRRNVFYETIGPALAFSLYPDEALFNYANHAYHNVFHKTAFAGIALPGKGACAFHDNIIKNNILLGSVFVANDTRWPWFTRDLAGKPVQLITGRLDGFVFERNNLFHRRAPETYLITHGSLKPPILPQKEVSWWENNRPKVFKHNLELDPLFVDASAHDYRLRPESPMIDAAAFLTATTGAGSGTTMPVENPGYFQDGYGIDGEAGDTIQLAGQTETARVLRIDYKHKRLVLDQALSWSTRQGVALRYAGKGPDLGAFESGLAEEAAAPPPQGVPRR
jgi:PKD repeat protein